MAGWGRKSYGAERAGLKRCSKCRKLKPDKDFAAHPACLDGLQSQCRKCHLRCVYAYEKKNWPYIQNYRKKYGKRYRRCH